MKPGHIIFCMLAWCGAVLLPAQTYPQFTQQPMDVSPDISGGYCVMRSHHFHAGLDFRTKRKEGWKVYAIADGYVKRIRITHYGYGKYIQIQHPNGYVSHYAHLSKYASPIDAAVKKYQYDQKKYEVEIDFQPGLIPVFQGQVIAYSGNSGGSTGPHLHFEIRDSANTMVFNPLLFGIKIADTKKPVLQGLRFYSEGSTTTIPIKKNKSGAYYMSGVSSLSAKGFWHLAYNAIDPQDGSGFKNSVYKVQLSVDGVPAFDIEFNKIKIDDLRSSDFHMDYAYWVKTGEYYEKLWLEPSNLLPIYNTKLADLSRTLSNGEHKVKLVLSDFYKNTTEFNFSFTFTAGETQSTEKVYVKHDVDQTITTPNGELSIFIPAHTLFSDITYGELPSVSSALNAFGEFDFTIGNKYIPLHNAFTLEVKTLRTKVSIQKLCIVYIGKEGKMRYYGPATINGDKIKTEIKDLGSFSVWADTISPVIKKLNIKNGGYIMQADTIETYATEELSDIMQYNAYIDGVWHLTEYEYKADLLFTPLPADLAPGKHTFEIEVLDGQKNRAYRKVEFNVTTNKNDLYLNKNLK